MSKMPSAIIFLLLFTTVLSLNLKNIFGMRRAQLGRQGRISTQLRPGIQSAALGSVNSSPVLGRSRASSRDSLPYNRLSGAEPQKSISHRVLAAMGKATFNAAVGSAAIAGGSVLASKLMNEQQNQTLILSLELPRIPEETATNISFLVNYSNGTMPTETTSSAFNFTSAEPTVADGKATGWNKDLILILCLSAGVGLLLVAVMCVLMAVILKKIQKAAGPNGDDIEMQ